ncbi:MAG TPA: HAD-IA family hydrolase [Patescibacteria group bacterium]|nr:HAD-IA family hydrolase [Patescibacteria group bacterium]
MKSKKILLLDMDGVVINKSEVFSIRISEKLNISIEEVLPFFKNEFQLCLVGKAYLKEELKKYTSRWGWKDSIENLLKFWFDGEKEVNQDILDKTSELRKEGNRVYLATNNEKYRVDFLWNKIGLKNYFDGIFSSAELGFKKPDPEFYLKALALLKTKPGDVIFFDDDEENVISAKEVGMDARFYSGINDFKV